LPRDGQAIGKGVTPVVAGCPWLCAQDEHSGAVRKCMVERLPSADRSQRILNSARRHRDSAARLCSACLVHSLGDHCGPIIATQSSWIVGRGHWELGTAF
jgi:hypothetical protein